MIIEFLIKEISSLCIKKIVKTACNYLSNGKEVAKIDSLCKFLNSYYTQINKKSLNDNQKIIVKRIEEILYVNSEKIKTIMNTTLLDKLKYAYEDTNRIIELKPDLAKAINLAKNIVNEQNNMNEFIPKQKTQIEEDFINKCSKRSYSELEKVKQKVLFCLEIKAKILAIEKFCMILEKNINTTKNINTILRINTHEYNGLISIFILKLSSIYELCENYKEGNIITTIETMFFDGYNVDEIKKEFLEYISNDTLIKKIKKFRNDIVHDLSKKTEDLSFQEIDVIIKKTIDFIKKLDNYFEIDEDDYQLISEQAKKDVEYYFNAIMHGLGIKK